MNDKATLTVISLDNITMRWEKPVDPKLALCLATMTDIGASEVVIESEKAFADMLLYGCGVVKVSHDGVQHIPFSGLGN